MHFNILNMVKLTTKATISCLIYRNYFISRIIKSEWLIENTSPEKESLYCKL